MTILTLITIFLVIIHFAILYFWIFDWSQLVTPVGFISWIGSIILGILVYFAYLKFDRSQRFTDVSRKLLFISTLMTIILAVLAFAIESITRSMP
jgi:drug/metabolite transporter (DMT)-like permease